MKLLMLKRVYAFRCSHDTFVALTKSYSSSQRVFKDFRVIPPSNIPTNLGCIGGCSFKSYVVDTDVYMDYLQNLFLKKGGKIMNQEFSNIADVINILHTYSIHHSLIVKHKLSSLNVKYDAIVNCVGINR